MSIIKRILDEKNQNKMYDKYEQEGYLTCIKDYNNGELNYKKGNSYFYKKSFSSFINVRNINYPLNVYNLFNVYDVDEYFATKQQLRKEKIKKINNL